MTKILILLFAPVAVFAQTTSFKPIFRDVQIGGQTYSQTWVDPQTQVLIKGRTPPSPPTEDKPTQENEYNRLPVLTAKVAYGLMWDSKKSMEYTSPSGQKGEYGQLEAGRPTNYYPDGYRSGLDYGLSFRIPTSSFVRRFNTGFGATMHESDCTPPVTGEGEYYSKSCGKSWHSFLYENWNIFSEYDLLIFKMNGSTKALSVGGFYANHDVTHTRGVEGDEIYQKNKELGAVLRYKIIRSDSSQAFSRWEVSLLVGPNSSYKVSLGWDIPILKKRINPPVRKEK